MPRKKKTDTGQLNGPEIDKMEVPTYTVMPDGELKKGLQVRHNIQLDKDIAERLHQLAQLREKTVSDLANKLLRQVLKI